MELYKIGSRGTMVRRIQETLSRSGYAIIADGIFGKKTDEAVRAFQKVKNLTPDGIVGPKTLTALGISEISVNQTVAIEQTDHTTLRLKRSCRSITEIIVHCTATPEGRDYTVEQCRADHKKRGFKDIGYHYLIYRDGTIHEGRDVNKIGAHCSNHNAHSIGISYVGGVENKSGVAYDKLNPKDTRTQQQKDALLNLLEALKMMYPMAKIYGHRDFAKKACPSFDAKEEYKNI